MLVGQRRTTADVRQQHADAAVARRPSSPARRPPGCGRRARSAGSRGTSRCRWGCPSVRPGRRQVAKPLSANARRPGRRRSARAARRRRAARLRARSDVEHDRDDDDVAERVGEADGLRETVRRRPRTPGRARAIQLTSSSEPAIIRPSSTVRTRPAMVCAAGREARAARPPRAARRRGSRRRRTTGTAPRGRARLVPGPDDLPLPQEAAISPSSRQTHRKRPRFAAAARKQPTAAASATPARPMFETSEPSSLAVDRHDEPRSTAHQAGNRAAYEHDTLRAATVDPT